MVCGVAILLRVLVAHGRGQVWGCCHGQEHPLHLLAINMARRSGRGVGDTAL